MAVAWLVMSLMLWFFVWLVKWVFMFMRDMAFEGDGLLAAHDLLMRWMLMLMLMVLVDVIGDGWMRRMLAGSHADAVHGHHLGDGCWLWFVAVLRGGSVRLKHCGTSSWAKFCQCWCKFPM